MSTSATLSVNKKGFTLIELLITISIIAILSAIGLIVYTDVLQKGKDAKRQADLRTIQSALEQYYSDQGFYPTNLPNGENPLTSLTGRPSPSPSSSPKTYLNATPVDPNKATETVNYNEAGVAKVYTGPIQIYQYQKLPSDCNNEPTGISTSILCTSYILCALYDVSPPAPNICTHPPSPIIIINCKRGGSCNGGVTPP